MIKDVINNHETVVDSGCYLYDNRRVLAVMTVNIQLKSRSDASRIY